MSIAPTQLLSLLQKSSGGGPQDTALSSQDRKTTARYGFEQRLDSALGKQELPSQQTVDQLKTTAELLQLGSLRNTLELMDDQAGGGGGAAELFAAVGVPNPGGGLQAYLQQSIQSLEAGGGGVTEARQPLPDPEPGPRSIEAAGAGIREGKGTTAPENVERVIAQASQRYGVDAGLIRAVIKTESNYNPRAVSHAGAQGLMQLMPATARGLGVSDPFDVEQNVMAGTRFLKGLLDRYNGNLDSALAAYNWGPGNVDRRPDRLPRETREYLAKVKQYYIG